MRWAPERCICGDDDRNPQRGWDCLALPVATRVTPGARAMQSHDSGVVVKVARHMRRALSPTICRGMHRPYDKWSPVVGRGEAVCAGCAGHPSGACAVMMTVTHNAGGLPRPSRCHPRHAGGKGDAVPPSCVAVKGLRAYGPRPVTSDLLGTASPLPCKQRENIHAVRSTARPPSFHPSAGLRLHPTWRVFRHHLHPGWRMPV
jgi:hypothetical protein